MLDPRTPRSFTPAKNESPESSTDPLQRHIKGGLREQREYKQVIKTL